MARQERVYFSLLRDGLQPFTRWITTAEKSDGATIRRNSVLSLTQISNDHKCHPAVALHCGHAGRVTLPVKRLQWRANAEWAVPRFLARPRGPRKPRGLEMAGRTCGTTGTSGTLNHPPGIAAASSRRPCQRSAQHQTFNHLTSKPETRNQKLETRNTKLSHLQTLKLSNFAATESYRPSFRIVI